MPRPHAPPGERARFHVPADSATGVRWQPVSDSVLEAAVHAVQHSHFLVSVETPRAPISQHLNGVPGASCYNF